MYAEKIKLKHYYIKIVLFIFNTFLIFLNNLIIPHICGKDWIPCCTILASLYTAILRRTCSCKTSHQLGMERVSSGACLYVIVTIPAKRSTKTMCSAIVPAGRQLWNVSVAREWWSTNPLEYLWILWFSYIVSCFHLNLKTQKNLTWKRHNIRWTIFTRFVQIFDKFTPGL